MSWFSWQSLKKILSICQKIYLLKLLCIVGWKKQAEFWYAMPFSNLLIPFLKKIQLSFGEATGNGQTEQNCKRNMVSHRVKMNADAST